MSNQIFLLSRSIFVLGFTISFSSFVKAQEISLNPATIGDLFSSQTLEAFWSPTSLAPGLKISFWGEASGCQQSWQGAVNGPTILSQSNIDPNFFLQVGLKKNQGSSSLWMPTGASSSLCSPEAQSRSGSSYVLMNTDMYLGGIGFFTFSSPTSFFNTYSHKGQGSSGVNQFILGNFFTQRFKKTEAITPWLSDQDSMRIRSIQTISSIKLKSEKQQVKQQMIVSLLNKKCSDLKIGNCQIQYLLNTAIFRQDPNYWNSPSAKWAQSVQVSKDPAQPGMTVVDGLIPFSGTVATYDPVGEDIPIYKSFAEPTLFTPEALANFDVRISFEQFKNALRIAAKKFKNRTSFSQTTDDDIAELFGPNWNTPSEWILLSYLVAQENYNENQDSLESSIGGSLRNLQIGSASLPFQWANFISKSSFSNTAFHRNKVQYDSGLSTMILSQIGSYIEAPIKLDQVRDLLVKMVTGPDQGFVEIKVNGQMTGTVDLYSQTPQLKEFRIPNIGQGNKYVRFTRTGSKNLAAIDSKISLHSFDLAPYNFSSFEYFLSTAVYKSPDGWFLEAHSGHIILNKDYSFVEVALKVLPSKKLYLQTMGGPNRGMTDVYINGQFFKSLDLYDSVYRLKLWTLDLPSEGNQLIRFVRSSRTQGSDGAIALDYISSSPP